MAESGTKVLAAKDTTAKLVGRHKRVAFMNTGTAESPVYTRMTGFTDLGESKDASEYNRQYVDEATERADVVGYATSVDYQFDRYTNTAVHDKLAQIADDEITGTDAQVDIVVVDLFESGDTANTCSARKRTWSVIPDASGDSTDALTYSGSFKAAGDVVKGTATCADGKWQTCTFTEVD